MTECRQRQLWSLLDAVEAHEARLRKWTKQTSKHGFRRPDAAKPNPTRGQWHPFWSPDVATAKPDANPANKQERKTRQ